MQASLRGYRIIPCDPDSRGERGLVAAMILQAIIDAQAGDPEAIYWMDHDAGPIADTWLDIHPDIIARWREVEIEPETLPPVLDPAFLTI